MTISQSSREALVGLGIDRERIHVVYLGLDRGELRPRERAPDAALVYLGRLKRYKRIELLLDVAGASRTRRSHIAGDGEHRAALEAEVAAARARRRAVFHGHVDEGEKARLLGEAWVALTASSAEGWCLTVIEAGACATPTAALRVGGLAEAIVDGQTGVLVDTPRRARRAGRRRSFATPSAASALGDAALARARRLHVGQHCIGHP